MARLTQTTLLLVSFLLYLLDQGTDAFTSLLFLLDGHYLEGGLTAGLIMAPGLASCVLELQSMWRGRGNCLLAGLYLLLCPLWVLLTHLLSIFHTRGQSKALMLKTMEGFLCSGPQLVLQLALWMRGTLTSPLQLVLADHLDVQSLSNLTQPAVQTVNSLQVFGRDFSSSERYMFGVAQLCSILISFLSLVFSVLHFNELEAKSVKSAGKFFLGLPFFLITIVFRTIAFSLLLCFLGWWSSCIIFIIFFTTVLTAVCIGDNFWRACVYGVWSFLVPVGYTKDPLEPLDYKQITTGDSPIERDAAEDESPYFDLEDKESVLRSRRSYFLTSHSLTSLVILYPSVAIMTILVHRAQVLQTLQISTTAIFPVSLLSYVFLPLLALCLAVSLLLVRPFHRADRVKGQQVRGTIIV